MHCKCNPEILYIYIYIYIYIYYHTGVAVALCRPSETNQCTQFIKETAANAKNVCRLSFKALVACRQNCRLGSVVFVRVASSSRCRRNPRGPADGKPAVFMESFQCRIKNSGRTSCVPFDKICEIKCREYCTVYCT